ncbi:hypothetical protein [Sorangium sp. So ce887]|uniref:hypothetical protein n=1 Tax=Sorangium sp. So ce887 TaxID=3133324 RepID=UPI003F6489F8
MNPSIRVEGYWVASGMRFSPGAVECAAQVPFSEKIEPGEIVSRGRYRGRPSLEGWGKYDFSVPPDDADLLSSKSEFLATLERCIPVYKAAGAQEIVLHFDVSYAGQCNLQLTVPLIRRLAELGVDVTITCFAIE